METTPNPTRRAVRWNANGQRYVIGRDQNGIAGLFADVGNGHWRPFDRRDLEDCRTTLDAEPAEILYVSIYRADGS